jgi:hypothetical protein
MFFLIFVLIFILIFAAFFIAQFYYAFFRGFAPFILTKNEVIKKIIDELKQMSVPANAEVYELGSGMAGFLKKMETNFPETYLTGMEYSFLPCMISQMQVAFTKSKIKILKKNFLEEDLSKADIIYCFLSIRLMELLQEKFKKELKPGAIVISYQFPLMGIEPVKIVKIGDGKEGSIYFYRF